MAWIEVHDSLLNHRKVARLSKLLSIPKSTVRGHMVTLWLNVLGQSPDGLFLSWDSHEIADAAEWPGDAQAFVDAILSAGFVERNEQYGCLQIHEWMEYAGSLKVAQRKRLQRERTKTSQDSHATVPGLSSQCPADRPDQTDQTRPTRPTSEAVRLADLLLELIRARKPDFVRKGNWAKDIDLLLRIDKRSSEDVEAVMRWCQADCVPRGSGGFCWANNILSGAKLREKFDRLQMDMRGNRHGRTEENRRLFADPDATYEGVTVGDD